MQGTRALACKGENETEDLERNEALGKDSSDSEVYAVQSVRIATAVRKPNGPRQRGYYCFNEQSGGIDPEHSVSSNP